MTKTWPAAAFFLFHILMSDSIACESFGNNAVFFPKLGFSFFEVPKLYPNNVWSLNYQFSLGTSFMKAIDYRFWFLFEGELAFIKEKQNKQVSNFMAAFGIKYFLWPGNFSPFIGVFTNYLHFFGELKNVINKTNWPIFVGASPRLGFSWSIHSEIAIIFGISYTFYFNINEAVLNNLGASLALAYYF